jgi:hypothetical protein
MIIRETPKDIEKYIIITESEIALKLQELEFYPKYIDINGVYFEKSTELDIALNKLTTAVK